MKLKTLDGARPFSSKANLGHSCNILSSLIKTNSKNPSILIRLLGFEFRRQNRSTFATKINWLKRFEKTHWISSTTIPHEWVNRKKDDRTVKNRNPIFSDKHCHHYPRFYRRSVSSIVSEYKETWKKIKTKT